MSKQQTYSNVIYFHDTDQASVVHHANYLNYMEEGRIEFLNTLGCPYHDLQKEHIGLAPIEVNIRYLSPLRLGDTFTVKTTLTTLKKASLVFEQDIYCQETLCTTATVKLACLNEAHYKVIPMPKKLYTLLSGTIA